MSEITFAKSFLSTLDSRPIKLRADHVVDPAQTGLSAPYTLPRLHAPHPEMPKKVKQTQAPGSSNLLATPVLEFSLPNSPLSTTTVQDLRDAVGQRVTDAQGNPVALEKIKILSNKKPVTGTGKTVAEILEAEPSMLVGGKEVEFKVMIIGGAKTIDLSEAQPATAAHEGYVPKPAIGPSGAEVVRTETFWNDLQGYLEQRLKDKNEADRLSTLFRDAYTSTQ
ncbi:Cell-cycle control medial ring component [Penicillium verhagenii]|nr:Cell-cycle control medial ring component [Penicillium verhagenii]